MTLTAVIMIIAGLWVLGLVCTIIMLKIDPDAKWYIGYAAFVAVSATAMLLFIWSGSTN